MEKFNKFKNLYTKLPDDLIDKILDIVFIEDKKYIKKNFISELKGKLMRVKYENEWIDHYNSCFSKVVKSKSFNKLYEYSEYLENKEYYSKYLEYEKNVVNDFKKLHFESNITILLGDEMKKKINENKIINLSFNTDDEFIYYNECDLFNKITTYKQKQFIIKYLKDYDDFNGDIFDFYNSFLEVNKLLDDLRENSFYIDIVNRFVSEITNLLNDWIIEVYEYILDNLINNKKIDNLNIINNITKIKKKFNNYKYKYGILINDLDIEVKDNKNYFKYNIELIKN